MDYAEELSVHTGTDYMVQPVCPGLDRIVNVAVSFHHAWKMPSHHGTCPICWRVHSDPADKAHYPRHLYQFLARCFPNLERVWIVDYMMQAKQKRPSTASYANGMNPEGGYCNGAWGGLRH